MGYFPLFVDLSNRPCLVIGGGGVAERKVAGLLGADATVSVISPQLTEQMTEWASQGRIHYRRRCYEAGDLSGYDIAFVATDDPAVNLAVYEEGKREGVWVNVADDPAHCDFIIPSVIRRDDLVIAVATGARSPALSRAVREELEAYFTEDYGTLARIAADVRRRLKESGTKASGEEWRAALDQNVRRLARQGKEKEAKTYLMEKLRR